MLVARCKALDTYYEISAHCSICSHHSFYWSQSLAERKRPTAFRIYSQARELTIFGGIILEGHVLDDDRDRTKANTFCSDARRKAKALSTEHIVVGKLGFQ